MELLRQAIDRTRIEGVATNLAFLSTVLADAEFRAGGVDTGFLQRFLGRAGAAQEVAAHG